MATSTFYQGLPGGGDPGRGNDPAAAGYYDPFGTAMANQLPGLQYQTAQTQQQQNLLSNQMNLALSGAGEQQAFMQGDLGRQLAGNQLDYQSLGNQVGTLGRQEKLTDQQYNLQRQSFGLQGKQQINQRSDIRQQGALSLENAGNQIKMDTSGAAGSGSLFTAGHRANQKYLADSQKLISDELGRALDNWNSQRQQWHLNQQGAALTYNEQKAASKDQEKNLKIMGDRLNLSKQDIKARAQNAINQLQLGTAMTVNDLMSAMVQNAQGFSTPLDSILGQVYQMTGMNPSAGGGGGSGSRQGG